jgi:hypothetical protein
MLRQAHAHLNGFFNNATLLTMLSLSSWRAGGKNKRRQLDHPPRAAMSRRPCRTELGTGAENPTGHVSRHSEEITIQSFADHGQDHPYII